MLVGYKFPRRSCFKSEYVGYKMESLAELRLLTDQLICLMQLMT
jgi:hypothetical protein